jgi:hypothetical protein
VALMLKRSRSTGEGFTLSLVIAAASLLVGAALYAWMARAYPVSAAAAAALPAKRRRKA